MNFQVAVDGPSATGKSTIAKMLAEHYSFMYIDTGAMYRSLAYLASVNKLDIDNEEELLSIFDEFQIEFKDNKVLCNSIDVTDEIRLEEIGIITSKIAKFKRIREALVAYQQELASRVDCIMDGRDIGTVVLPNAQVKIYLDASVESRAKRRYDELVSKGIESDYSEVFQAIEARDYEDINRDVSPLRKASDAIYVDSSTMTIEEEFNLLCEIIGKKREEVGE